MNRTNVHWSTTSSCSLTKLNVLICVGKGNTEALGSYVGRVLVWAMCWCAGQGSFALSNTLLSLHNIFGE